MHALGVAPVTRVRLDEEVQEREGIARRHAGTIHGGEGSAVIPVKATEPVVQRYKKARGEGGGGRIGGRKGGDGDVLALRSCVL